MARAIDADKLQELCNRRIQGTWNNGTAPVSWAAAYADFKDDIDSMPTLTPPNEGVKDKNVLTNGPLTLEELRLMIEPTPVWWDWVQGWVLARKGMIISWNGVYYNFEEVKGNFYRRPPEEPLTCEGCVHEINEHENCNYCIRAGYLGDYYCRRTPEGEEEA